MLDLSVETVKCRITIIKRTINQDLVNDFLEEEYVSSFTICDQFSDGQVFTIESLNDLAKPPKNFCPWAWADIRKDIVTVSIGGNMPGLKHPGTIISGCTDVFRPVYFKIERLEPKKSEV